MALTGPVLRREAIRTARRWQTYALRWAVSTCVMLLVAYTLWDVQVRYNVDISYLGIMGRKLFQALVGSLFTITIVLAPLMVASGIEEEREAQTLDLLSLTGLSASQLMWDKILSRILVLLTVIVGSLPFLAIISTFGGFSVGEAVNATVGMLLAALILGIFAAFVATVSRGGPIVALVLCVPYVLFTNLPVAAFFLWFARDDDLLFTVLAPALLVQGEPYALASVLLWMPALISGWPLAVSVFRIATSDDGGQGFGLLSTEFWVIERFRKRTWFMLLFSMVSTVPFIAVWILDPLGIVSGWLVYQGVVWLWCGVLLMGLHRMSLMMVLAAVNALKDWSAKNTGGWQRLAQNRVVRGQAVYWRETATASAGIARFLPHLFAIMWTFFALFMVYFDGLGKDEVHGILMGVAFFSAWVATALVCTSVAIDERRRRTVPLMLLTQLGARGLVHGKHLASMRIGALLVAFGVLSWLTVYNPYGYSVHAEHSHFWGPNIPMPRVLAMLVWLPWGLVYAGNVGLFSRLVVHWVPRQMGWVAGLAAGFLWVMGPFMIIVFFEEFLDLDGMEYAASLLFPVIDERAHFCKTGGLPNALWMGLALQMVAALGLRRALAWRFRKMAAVKG